MSKRDTLEGLQQELAVLKDEYFNGLSSVRPAALSFYNADFAARESDIGTRFRKIGHSPSYPSGYLEGTTENEARP